MNKKSFLKNKYQEVTVDSINGYDNLHVESNDGVVVSISYTGGYYFISHTRNNDISLEFVRGYIEKNETPVEAALREINEELHITKLDIADVNDYGYGNPDNAIFNQKIHFINVQLKFQPKFELQTDEGVVGAKWYDKYETAQLIKQNKVQDMFTLAFYAKLQKSI